MKGEGRMSPNKHEYDDDDDNDTLRPIRPGSLLPTSTLHRFSCSQCRLDSYCLHDFLVLSKHE